MTKKKTLKTLDIKEEEAIKEEIPISKEKEEVTITKENLVQLEKRSSLADEYLDHLRRLKAEFENYKKREEKLKTAFVKFANENLITELLPVMDSLDRALNGVDASHNLESFLPGIELIRKQLEDVLVKNGLARIETVGKPFDPRVHEAIMQLESDEQPENTVIQELRKGYLLNNKVIRVAQVAVSKPKKEEDNYVKDSGN